MRGLAGSRQILLVGLLFPAGLACAQTAPDAVDPSLITGERPAPRQRDPLTTPKTAIEVEPASNGVEASGPEVFVGAITISGLQRLTPADFSDIVAVNIGRTLSAKDLANLASALADRARSRGYVFATAAIQPQHIKAGMLDVVVIEGGIDELRFDGPALASVKADLAPLIGSGPVLMRDLERRLLLAGDNAGVRIRSSKYVRQGRRGILVVQASRDPISARATLSNQGTRTIGPVQLRIEADLNGLIDSRDRLSVTYSTTPVNPSELQFGRIRYAHDLGSAGTELALSATRSATRPGSYLAPFAFRTRAWSVAASLTQPLLRQRNASFWLEGELGLRTFVQWRSETRIRRDRLSTARLMLYGNAKVAGGRWRMSGGLTQGLGVLGATRLDDPLASRSDSHGVFTAFSGWSDWTTELGDGVSLRLAAQGQLALTALPISEETTLGGTGFLRGYDWGERSGDQGAAGLAELRYLIDNPLGLVRRAQVYAYADGGVVSNLEDGNGGGSLASAGGGMRVDLSSNMGATFEVAVPLSGSRYDTGNAAPKINLGLIRSF